MNLEPVLNPIPCQGLRLLEVFYPEVKILINAQAAKIFTVNIQHTDGANSKKPGADLWYDSVNGNCLAGTLKFNEAKAEAVLRNTSGFNPNPQEVKVWCKRLFANPILRDFKLVRINFFGVDIPY